MENILQLLIGGTSRQLGIEKGYLSRPFRYDHILLNILGNVDHDRTGSARSGHFESLFNRVCEVLDIHDQVAVLDHRKRHSKEIGFLECGFADELRINLAGNANEGRAIHEGVRDGRHQIGGPRTASRHAYSRFTRCSCISLSGERTALLVAGENRADPVLRFCE